LKFAKATNLYPKMNFELTLSESHVHTNIIIISFEISSPPWYNRFYFSNYTYTINSASCKYLYIQAYPFLFLILSTLNNASQLFLTRQLKTNYWNQESKVKLRNWSRQQQQMDFLKDNLKKWHFTKQTTTLTTHQQPYVSINVSICRNKLQATF